VFYVTVNRWRVRDPYASVTASLTEATPYLSGFLAGVTVMTLMTMIYGLILDRERISTS
jgi:hypothetical protein